MKTWEEELEDALAKEEEVVGALLKEAVRKTPALQVGNISELDTIVNREQPLLLQLQNLQKDRQALLAEHGLNGEPLSAVISKVPGGRALALRNNTLRRAAENLQRVNSRNDAIARSRLARYNRLLKKIRPPQVTYTNSGVSTGTKAERTFIDKKI